MLGETIKIKKNLNGNFEAFTVVLFRVPVLRDVMLHHLANGSPHFESILGAIRLTHHHIPDDQNTHAACSTPLRWKQTIILNCRYTFTKLHTIESWNNAVVILVINQINAQILVL